MTNKLKMHHLFHLKQIFHYSSHVYIRGNISYLYKDIYKEIHIRIYLYLKKYSAGFLQFGHILAICMWRRIRQSEIK